MDQIRAISGRESDQEEPDLLKQRTAEAHASSNTATLDHHLGRPAGHRRRSAAIGWLMTSSLTKQIGTAVGHVQSSSAELQAAANQQATGAKEQATAMSEITTTISELLATSRQIAESAQRVAQIAEQTARRRAHRPWHGRHWRRIDIGGIRRQVDQIVAHMLELGKKSQQIGAVLEIVSELAEQTNILAINATIEAAGAGESGKRFAVVADEIRKLADRVGGSTKEIRTLIEDVRSAVNTTVMATESGSKAVDAGTRQFGDVAAAFKQIAGLVTTTTEAAREIELSTKQQTTAVEQVNVAIANVAQASKETEASAGQTLQTASQLAALCRRTCRASSGRSRGGLSAWPRTRTGISGSKRASSSIGSARGCSSSRRAAAARLVQRLLRLAHTLKGAARVVKQPEIADRAHAIEDALSPFRESAGRPWRASISMRSSSTSTASATALPGSTRPERGRGAPRWPDRPPRRRARAVRAEIAEMDAVLDGVVETHALLNGLRGAAETVGQMQHLVDSLAVQLGPRGACRPGTADKTRP